MFFFHRDGYAEEIFTNEKDIVLITSERLNQRPPGKQLIHPTYPTYLQFQNWNLNVLVVTMKMLF